MRYMVCRHVRNGRPVFWDVTIDNGLYGDYLSEYAALLDAVDVAQEAGEAGQVLTHGIDGPDIVRWSYGDPYPYSYRLHG
jgi:hypothetical protein